MVGWTIVMLGIMVIGVVVVFKWKQRQADHIAYWQQQRQVEARTGEAASRLPDSVERRQKMAHAKASVERSHGELTAMRDVLGAVEKVDSEREVRLRDTDRSGIAYACKATTLSGIGSAHDAGGGRTARQGGESHARAQGAPRRSR